MANILDDAVKLVKPSNQKFITRYHNTNDGGVRGILEYGSIRPTFSPGAEEEPRVYTTANGNYWREFSTPYRLRLRIPKEWYTRHAAIDSRDYGDIGHLSEAMGLPEYEDIAPYERAIPKDFGGGYYRLDRTYGGGRTSLFDDEVPAEFIDEICDRDDCYSVDDWKRLYMGKPTERESKINEQQELLDSYYNGEDMGW